MKNGVTYILWILSIAFILTFCVSCGARKVQKSESKEQTKIESTDNSVITSNIDTFTKLNVVNKDQSVTNESVFEPIDNTKEAFIIDPDGKKTVLNNSRKVIRNIVAQNNTVVASDKVEKQAVKEQKAVKQVSASKKENSSKDTEKSNTPWYYYLLLLIPISLIYWLGKKYRIF